MLRSLTLLQRNSGLTLVLSISILLAGACSSSSGAQNGDAGLGDTGSGNDLGGAGSGGAGGSSPLNTAGLGPARVELGLATNLAAPGSYVLLAKTGISNVTGSAIGGGHLGLSPSPATEVTGFAKIADATNAYWTSTSLVPPARIYTSTDAAPTPSNLTTAVIAMQAAYSDAAGRSNPNFLNLLSGSIGGQTLAPGLYTWGTSVNIAENVTISGGANDVWIFQISNDLDVTASKSVILGGSAQAKNIFWQVAGQATIHANAHFEGIILSQTAITMQTTATFHGRAMAQSMIAIDNNSIAAP